MYRRNILLIALIAGLVLAGCTPAAATPAGATGTATGPAVLTPFYTPRPSATATATPPGTPTPLPSPTPTPRTHTVARGEDLGGIAFRYGVSLAELIAANPQVNANAMPIGTVLIIPGSATAATETAPLPTPDSAVQIGAAHCARGRDGGVWCFAMASNPTQTDYESITAVFRIASPDGSNASAQTTAAGMNLLPAGKEVALAAFFPAPAPWPLAASAELASSFPRSQDDGRYLKVQIENEQIEIAADGLSARVRGEVVLKGEQDASQVQVSAAALNEQKVVGVRRWDRIEALPESEKAGFEFTVYSTGLPIERVTLLAEARP